MLWQEWWVWIVAGLVLAVLEVIAPAFILLGFSIGALVTGVLIAIGLLGTTLPVLILIFAVISLLSWIALRKIFGVRHGQIKIWHRDINED